MPISHSGKFIYVHIPRTGGTSITLSLQRIGVQLSLCGRATSRDQKTFGEEQVWLHHAPAYLLRRQICETDWKSFLKFSFVRNPWDWVVSTYFYHLEQMNSAAFRRDWPQIAASLDRHDSFESWVLREMYMQDQASFLLNQHGLILIDHVAKFEFLDEEFGAICTRLGLNCPLARTNESKHGYYRDYYSTQMRIAVGRRFERDVTLFKYEF